MKFKNPMPNPRPCKLTPSIVAFADRIYHIPKRIVSAAIDHGTGWFSVTVYDLELKRTWTSSRTLTDQVRKELGLR